MKLFSVTAAFVCAESDGIEKYHIKVVKECVQKEYSAKTMNKIDTQLSQPTQMAFCLVEAAMVRTAGLAFCQSTYQLGKAQRLGQLGKCRLDKVKTKRCPQRARDRWPSRRTSSLRASRTVRATPSPDSATTLACPRKTCFADDGFVQ